MRETASSALSSPPPADGEIPPAATGGGAHAESPRGGWQEARPTRSALHGGHGNRPADGTEDTEGAWGVRRFAPALRRRRGAAGKEMPCRAPPPRISPAMARHRRAFPAMTPAAPGVRFLEGPQADRGPFAFERCSLVWITPLYPIGSSPSSPSRTSRNLEI